MSLGGPSVWTGRDVPHAGYLLIAIARRLSGPKSESHQYLNGANVVFEFVYNVFLFRDYAFEQIAD